MILIVMGVTGAGKTTIGKLLADRLGYPFLDADDFHPPTNVAKMTAGEPLTDEDRMPWLQRLKGEIRARQNAVLACSALKRSYRSILGGDDRTVFVYLRVDRSTIVQRLKDRGAHFMNPALIESQFDTLEEPDGSIVVDASDLPEQIVSRILASLDAWPFRE